MFLSLSSSPPLDSLSLVSLISRPNGGVGGPAAAGPHRSPPLTGATSSPRHRSPVAPSFASPEMPLMAAEEL